MEPILAYKVFEILRKDESNRYCADCNSLNPSHAAINHGIFICNKCAASHNAMNGISIIKGLSEDEWDVEELKFMISGGNAAMRDYLMFYGFTIETAIHLKYKTKAAAFYRNMLGAISRENNFEASFLSLEEGAQKDEENLPNPSPQPESLAQAVTPPATKEDPREQFFSPQPETGIRSWFIRKFNQFREAGNNAFKSINEFGNNATMRDIESRSLGLVNKVKNTFVSTAEESIKHEFAENYKLHIAECTNHTFSSINLSLDSQKIKKEAMEALVNPQVIENQ